MTIVAPAMSVGVDAATVTVVREQFVIGPH
ncbi:hypothetical protein EDF25_0307 [Curtobacterium sp. PhB131]|nr:hypothetical protein EDF25_0307 [Curtobacterium sp. PhB131]